MLKPMTTLVWFRQDLRTADNPALTAARDAGGAVIPVYLHAPAEEGDWAPGGASRWWLHHSLARLTEDLRACGAELCLRATEDSLAALQALIRETGATRVLWNRRYEPAIIARDQRIKAALREAGIETQSFNSALLHEPWSVKTKSGGPFQVFTPFWRHCLSLPDPGEPLPAPAELPAPRQWPLSDALDSLQLLPRIDWTAGLRTTWTPGSRSAHALLQRFLDEAHADYATARDLPAVQGTSRLSPHLHLGELSPREVWHGVRRAALARGDDTGERRNSWPKSAGESSLIISCTTSHTLPCAHCARTMRGFRG
jgi:deoxyribodipyrimidine photo-lyase